MNHRILITGSSGLVGNALVPAFESRMVCVERLDLHARGAARGDVRDRDRVQRAMRDCEGVIHLAAVSRVIWGQHAPDFCWSTNVDGLRNVLEAAACSGRRPWVVFASSREVYGQPARLPASEDCPLRPVNIYGRSKVAGEQLVAAAQRDGIRACVIRLSNVFGTTADHADRVVPAFARGAIAGEPLRVDGADHAFDFTHIDDVARGIVSLAALLGEGGKPPPPIHFVTGIPTTLGELAQMAIEIAGSRSRILHSAPRDFDVARFVGNPARAGALLGWLPQVGLREGLTRLIHGFRNERSAVHTEATAS
ncbi:MAG: NAD(P)-dependent oxidoreductase [Proteobacteria bacterium]|nr:NAD(P)-dependent oxidoreductase [Pseudomonadota bacterium]